MDEQVKKELIDMIEKGKKISDKYKNLLFPNIQQEYKLDYANKIRKEDLLADEDGSFSVPIQVERTF